MRKTNAKLKRTEKARVGVEKVVTLPTDPAKAQRAAEGLQVLRNALATNGKQLVMDLFCEIDLSGDGRVSLPEFRLAMRALGMQLPKLQIAELFRLFDADRSGYIEFRELWDSCCT